MDRATFTAMTQSTKADWHRIEAADAVFNAGLADRVLTHLQMLKGDCGGFSVDRLEHSLQSATLAYRDRQDDEYVVCALLHDMGDILRLRQSCRARRNRAQTIRVGRELVDAATPRHFPRLLFLSLHRT